MTKINLLLEPHSNGIHVQQIYTGLEILSRNSVVYDLQVKYNSDRVKKCKKLGFRSSYSRCVVLHVNSIVVVYDMNDNPFVTEELLSIADVYFKRSYSREVLVQYGSASERIRPYGLNYLVYPSGTSTHGIYRTFRLNPFPNSLKVVGNYCRVLGPFSFVPRENIMYNFPDNTTEPRVLFLARLWDPFDSKERSEAEVEDRLKINASRIASIRLLKKEFGNRFFGGLADSSFSRKRCPDLIISDKRITSPGGYIRLMRDFPICIATAGLSGSNGYKLAEYVAFSKAIVSEPIQYQVAGDFEENVNYLKFTTPEESVEKVRILLDGPQMRHELMKNNWDYYQRFLAPDKIVQNSINYAINLTKHESKV